MGSAEIYQALEAVPELLDALVLGVEEAGDKYWMPLFVVLTPGMQLDDGLIHRIREVIRERASPRHVPDEVRLAPGVPRTRTGKKLEVPVKRLLQGAPLGSIDSDAVDDPDTLAWYALQSRR